MCDVMQHDVMRCSEVSCLTCVLCCRFYLCLFTGGAPLQLPKVSLEGRRNGREREEEGRERGGEEKERRGEGKEGRGEWKERVG